ncbi:MAG TPA: hypothetical protein VL137_09385, partial [Polyangiaceae bacterium]|nr:hypothetical protein [Polyangiaceae bacterium]
QHAAIVTLPVIADLAIGNWGTGLGLQLSRSFSADVSAQNWQGGVGLAQSIDERNDLMLIYVQETERDFSFADGWCEASFVHRHLLGTDHLSLLSLLGRSTHNNSEILLGIRINE